MSRKKSKRNIIIGQFEVCKKCGLLMDRTRHEFITSVQLLKPYYFSEWDYCNPKKGGCGMVQLYEKYKVNKQDMPNLTINLFV